MLFLRTLIGMEEGFSQNDVSRAKTHPNRVSTRSAEVLSASLETPLQPGLYLVATPIGNLADITLRALSVLARADLIFCEDTRRSRKLLSHFDVSGDLQAYHDHNAERERPRILTRIREGQSVALISDAGTPLISDPGYKLVRAVQDEGLFVTVIPGPSASIAALTVSGLPTDRFFFEGFLPTKPGQRKKRLEKLADIPATLIFFETANRLASTLVDMVAFLGMREAAIVKELTKLHESVARGALDKLCTETKDLSAKGEFVIAVAPPEIRAVSDQEIEEHLEVALQKMSLRDAVSEVAKNMGLHRNRIYSIALALKAAMRDGGSELE